MILTALGNDRLIATERLEEVLRAEYAKHGEVHVVHLPLEPGSIMVISISVSSERGGHTVELSIDGRTVTIDGYWEEGAEVAALVRSTLPADFPTLILMDDDATGFAYVPAGATAESVAAGWRDISHYPYDA